MVASSYLRPKNVSSCPHWFRNQKICSASSIKEMTNEPDWSRYSFLFPGVQSIVCGTIKILGFRILFKYIAEHTMSQQIHI